MNSLPRLSPGSLARIGASTLLYLALVFTSAACKTNHRLPPSPGQSGGKVAIVVGGDPVRLIAVDGKEGPNFQVVGAPKTYNSAWGGNFRVEMEPGLHELNIGYLMPNRRLHPTFKTINMKFDAGRTYRLTMSFQRRDWEPVVTEAE